MEQGSVDSVAHPGWDGKIENRPFNHLPRNSRKNLFYYLVVPSSGCFFPYSCQKRIDQEVIGVESKHTDRVGDEIRHRVDIVHV